MPKLSPVDAGSVGPASVDPDTASIRDLAVVPTSDQDVTELAVLCSAALIIWACRIPDALRHVHAEDELYVDSDGVAACFSTGPRRGTAGIIDLGRTQTGLRAAVSR